jgi:Tol biopolymer transport system component/DNA-binding winged helix-turn-helix (wHTH) protein
MVDPLPIRAYRFGPYSLDPSRRTLTRDALPVAIAGKAFDVLLALLERRGQVVEKQELLRLVWPDVIVEEANLSQQIFTLRKLLGETADRRSYIATAPKRGYGFFGDVEIETRPGGAPGEPRGSAIGDGPVVRLTLNLPPEAPLALSSSAVLAVSADGRRVVYVAVVSGGTQLYLRELDSFEAHAIAGTEGAQNPFFSPDGEWIGFVFGRRLLRVPATGGVPRTICELEGEIRGASWGSDGHIVFAPGPATGLWRVAAEGGTPATLTALRFDQGERTHRWPFALPDGQGVLFTIGSDGSSSFDEGSLAITEPDGGHRIVLYHGTDGRYVPTGHLVYARRGALLKTPFDPETGQARGSGRPILSGLATAATGAARYAIASTGLLAYVAGEMQTLRRSLVVVGQDGRIVETIVSGEGLEEPRLSPDKRRFVIGLRGRHTNLWLYDFAQAPMMRLTFEGDNFAAIWCPDSETITFSSNRAGSCDIFWLRPDAGASAEPLVSSEFDKVPGSWTQDGSLLAYTEYNPESGADLWIYDAATTDARPFLRSRSNEYAPCFSPDGQLIAFTSDLTGQPEVYVARIDSPETARRVSTDGGNEPLWVSDGRGLIYRNSDRVMLVDMTHGPDQASIPLTLFEGRYVPGTLTGLANYDHGTAPGTFLMLREDEIPRPEQLSVVLNWFGELRGK